MLRNNCLITIILLFIVFQIASCQNNGANQAGSAFELSGRVRTIAVFISERDKQWTEWEKRANCDKLLEAHNWLQAQGKLWNVDVSFDIDTVGYEEDILFDTISQGFGSGNERVDWAELIAKKLGYATPLEWYNTVKKQDVEESIQIIIFAKESGTGYALAFEDGMDEEKYFFECAILYQQYLSGGALAPASLAHEMLHLYGSWDLYETFQQSAENAAEAAELFPNSIMRIVTYDFNDVAVDSLTAWRIGWNEKPEKWFYKFEPK